MARKLKIKSLGAGHSATFRKMRHASSSARRHPLTIAQTLRIGSRPNLAQLPSRAKH